MSREGLGRLRAALAERDYLRFCILASRKIRVVQLDRVLIMGTEIDTDRPMLRKLRDREPGLSVRAADPAEAGAIASAFPHHANRYGGWFKRGDTCLLVLQEAKPIAMGWVRLQHRGVIDELGTRLELLPTDAWGYDTFVQPEHRARGAFVVLMWEMFRFLRERGFTHIYASVTWENQPSRAAHTRLGYHVATVIDRFWVLGLRIYRLEWPALGRTQLRPALGGAPAIPITR
jgi:GNAT superfamily N-acetyltransferase